MKPYQVYFFFLKALVLLQVVMIMMGYKVKENSFFAVVDTIFKISLGLFLGIYFSLFRPKGIEWEDGLIISVGGLLILTDIQFEPLMKIYNLRDATASSLASSVQLPNRNV